MKSPMVHTQSYIMDKSGYSDLQVLRSGAGWYVGTTYWNTEDPTFHFEEPGSRDSDYFATKEEAEGFLKELEGGNEEAIGSLRMHP